MDEYTGRVLADRYRLPRLADDEDLLDVRAFDTYSGQEVHVRQVPLPEVVDAEMVDAPAAVGAPSHRHRARGAGDPAVQRAVHAAQSAARIPDHPRLDQVFDVFAEDGSLWIVSELVAARPLSALLAERPLGPYRAAEIASDLLTAVRVLHAHGWVHRNITVRTVLVCDDGRVVLTGLAAGAAEEALCGYAPVPEPPAGPETSAAAPSDTAAPMPPYGQREVTAPPGAPGPGPEQPRYGEGRYGEARREDEQPGGQPQGGPGGYGDNPYGVPRPSAATGAGGATAGVPAPPGHAAFAGPGPYQGGGTGTSGALPRAPRQQSTPGVPAPYGGPNARPALPGNGNSSGAVRAARAGAIAAYRAGARAAARASEEEQRRQDGARRAPGGPQEQGGRQPSGPWPGDGQAGPGAPYEGAAEPAPGGSPYSGPPAQGGSPGGDWWATPPAGQQEAPAPEGSEGPDDGQTPPPRHAHLEGTWDDGPRRWDDASGSVPAGGRGPGGTPPYGPTPGRDGQGGPEQGRGRAPALPAGYAPAGQEPGARGLPPAGAGHPLSGTHDPLFAAAQPSRLPVLPEPAGRWDGSAEAGTPAFRGPATPLAAERARQARIAVVGAVTERWAPEQAGLVHENWQLAPPIGPATDLWALGALLYRAVQGHAPYPEESAAELVQLVCSEPPAFAEECGPLRPVVESLLRQDPTERPDFEELRGWLRSLIRSAPEPEAGEGLVSVPSVDSRLPIKRRKGELVRRRRWRRRRAERDHGRHRQGLAAGASAGPGPARSDIAPVVPDRGLAADLFEQASGELYERPERVREQGGGRRPRSLGRTLLVLILLGLAAAILYALYFLPKSGEEQGGSVQEQPAPVAPSATGTRAGRAAPGAGSASHPTPAGSAKDTAAAPVVSSTGGPHLAKGFVLRKDPAGFEIGVRQGWRRQPVDDTGQVRYVDGGFTLLVVPGRDGVKQFGSDPLAYQSDKEPELAPFRSSTWASASGLRRIDVGEQAMAEGQYTWQDSNGSQVYVRNLAMIIGGRYHIIQVIGPDSQRDEVTEIYQQATASYRAG